MDKTLKTILIALGIVAGFFLLFKFILPVLFTIIGSIIAFIFQLLLWAIGIFVVLLILAYLIRYLRK